MRTPSFALIPVGLTLAGCSGHELLDPSTSRGTPIGAEAGGVRVQQGFGNGRSGLPVRS